MIRLVLLLCAGLYLAALVLGADHGQKRSGLMMADRQPKPAAVAQVARPQVFVPAQPVMQPVVQPATPPQNAAPQSVTAAPLPEPEIAGGILYQVAAIEANVRDGPGRSFAVTASLGQGEQVLVVPEDQPIEGWSRIRIEGDGAEGYISTSLLARSR